MIRVIALGVLVGLVGCGSVDAAPQPDATCEVGWSNALTYTDCHTAMGARECLTDCGEADPTGMVNALPVGCQVTETVGVTVTHYVCVASCGECQ
jgi:hypothetical protein